jgi:hypothetical protein
MTITILSVASALAIYWFWIDPILKSRPAFRDIYADDNTIFEALKEKLKGIKQKLSSVVVICASGAVTAYDFFNPIISGVDVTPLTSHVPSWAWPLVLISTTALFQFLRNLADARHKAELNAGTPQLQEG